MEKPFQMYKNLFVEYIQSGCDVGNEMGREMYIEDKSLDIYFAIISNLKKLEEWEFSFFIPSPPDGAYIVSAALSHSQCYDVSGISQIKFDAAREREKTRLHKSK